MMTHESWRKQLRHIQDTVRNARKTGKHIAPGVVAVSGLTRLGQDLSKWEFHDDVNALEGARVHLCEMLAGFTGVDSDSHFMSAEVKKNDVLLSLNIGEDGRSRITWSLFDIMSFIPSNQIEFDEFPEAIAELDACAVGLEKLAQRLRNLARSVPAPA